MLSSSIPRHMLVFCLGAYLFATSVSAQQAMRKWTDKTGKFEVEAKLVKQADGSVQLLKQDGRMITVPIAALSAADQAYLLELANAKSNPFAGGVPMQGGDTGGTSASNNATSVTGSTGLSLLTDNSNPRELPISGDEIFTNIDEPIPPLSADPLNSIAQFREFARPLQKADAYARTSMPVLIDPRTPTFGVSVHRVGNAVDPATYGRIYLVDPTQNRPKLVIDLKQTILLLDHHVASGRSLAVLGVNSPSDRGGDLVLLADMSGGKPSAIARWRLPGWNRPGFKPKVEFARLLDQQRAIVQVNDSVFMWELESGKALFKIDRIQSGAKLAVSGTGKYLAIPKGGGCYLVDTQVGELLGVVPFPSTLTPAVHFSPDGEQLALVAGNQYVIWSLANADVVTEMTIGSSSGAFYGWVGNKYLLTQLGGLIDPQLRMTLWSYGVPSNNQAITIPGGVIAIDRLTVATLLCLPVPHAPVASVAKKLAGGDDKLMALRPGSQVALQVKAINGVDEDEIRAGLKAAVEKAGWKISKQASITVVANIGRGDKQTLHFRDIGAPFRSPGQTVTIKPYTASVEIRKGSKVLWSRSTTNMVPNFIRLKQGETLKKVVKKYENADPSYFIRLTLPSRILRPELRKAVGRSRIKNGKWVDYFPQK